MSDEVLARVPRSPQLPGVSETVTTARRWNSFVCPGCRCVFRVPQDHDGKGVVCPACRIMLRLPGPEDELPPLVTPAVAVAEPVEVEDDDYEDDSEDTEADEAVAAARSDRTFVAILVLTAVVLVGVVAWWLMPEKKPAGPVSGLPESTVPAGGAGSGAGSGLETGSGSGSGATSGEGSGTGGDGSGATAEQAMPLLVEIESAVKAFLQAPTREASLARVLDPAEAARKWDVWFAGEAYAAPGFEGLAGDPITTGSGEGATTRADVRTSDYKLRVVNLIRHDGELKVDWDSWVGWSEMTWEDFRAKKPVEPVLFRVLVSPASYFNFDFRDELQWSSYRLESDSGLDALHGYVPRTGPLDQRLRPADAAERKRWVLMLKYPPGATRDDQVLIDSVVTERWLLLDEGKGAGEQGE